MTTDLDPPLEREELRRWARRNRAKQPCPVCGSEKNGLPIVWGLPDSPALFELEEKGELTLGGCVIFEDPPARWRCGSCGHQWRVHLRLV